MRRTQAWREEHHVQVCQELLLIGIEVAKTSNNIARQAHTDDLKHGLEDQQTQMC